MERRRLLRHWPEASSQGDKMASGAQRAGGEPAGRRAWREVTAPPVRAAASRCAPKQAALRRGRPGLCRVSAPACWRFPETQGAPGHRRGAALLPLIWTQNVARK